MKPRNILLLLLLLATSGLYGQIRSRNVLPASGFRIINAQTCLVRNKVFADAQPTDTIYHIAFATRVDTLLKYLNKYVNLEPTDTCEIVFKDGIPRPDLQTGDLLRVTSENGAVKDYFLKLDDYIPGTDAYLGSITWPDMPSGIKIDMINFYGWHGDTVPSFNPTTMNYELILPLTYQKIPALTYATRHPNATVKVTRARSLEGTPADRTITFTVTAEDGTTTNVYSVLLKKEQDTIAVQSKSTISSMYYKVSPGYSLAETIRGITIGTTVAGFYAKITRANELQALKVISSANGAELANADIISSGDTLTVVSADKIHTTKYFLNVTPEGLSSNALLTSAVYTVSVNGSSGTITGFPKYTLLKKILNGVVIPEGANLTMVDQNNAYATITKLNFDTVYVSVTATSAIYFEVVAENGKDTVLYQLLPTSSSSDAYVTSDVYIVDNASLILYAIQPGTSVNSLFRNVTPAPKATLAVYDKKGFVRSSGIIYKDDKLAVTSEDGTTRNVYHFGTLVLGGGPYVAFVVSDVYGIDQINYWITGVPEGENIAEFLSKLYPTVGSTLKVVNAYGNESTLPNLQPGDKLVVTSADGTQITTYMIATKTGIGSADTASLIRMAPNPTTDRIEVQGLVKGNRISVLNVSGIVLRDLIADSSAVIVSFDGQPQGVYIIVVSDGAQPIKIQKIVKE